MAIQILTDNETGYQCFFCSTTMWAFGGIFYDHEDPKEFLEWCDVKIRTLTDQELNDRITEWRLSI